MDIVLRVHGDMHANDITHMDFIVHVYIKKVTVHVDACRLYRACGRCGACAPSRHL